MEYRMRTLMPLIAAVALLVSPCLSAAQAPSQPDPIDAWLEASIQKDPSAAGVKNATNEAKEMWDKEMNRCYKRLMSRLSTSQQATLRASQLEWLKFRDSEFEVISQLIATKDGTMWQMVATSMGMQLVKDRTLQIRVYDALLDD